MKENYKLIKTLFIFGSVFLFNSFRVFAQAYEVGGMLGFSNYRGDVSTYNFQTPNYGFSTFFKYNANFQSIIRVNLYYGAIHSKDNFSNFEMNKNRNTSFSSNIGDFSVLYEHNFFPLHNPKVRRFISPYVFGGLGMFTFSSESNSLEIPSSNGFQPVIPFGFGIKRVLNPMWTLNVEFGARKTFSDKIDGVNNKVDDYQYGFYGDMDWYYFTSIGLSYTFYRVICPNDQL